MRRLKDHQLDSERVRLIENEIKEARSTQSSLKKYIDTRGYIDFKLNEAIWTGNVIYVPINGGTAFIMGNYITIEGMIDYNITNPSTLTNYFIFLNKDGSISHDTSPVELDDNMLLGSVSTGFTLDELVTKDLRRILRKDNLWEEVQEARGPYDRLKEYIDSKGFSDFLLGTPIYTDSVLRVPIKPGRAYILDTMIQVGEQMHEIPEPTVDTVYYYFINKNGELICRESPTEAAIDELILGTITVGSTLDDLVVQDLRRLYVKDGILEEVKAARGNWASLDQRLDHTETRSVVIQIKELLLASQVATVQAIVPENLEITKVLVKSTNEPVGGDLVIDINKNGTSIFTDQTKRPRVIDGSFDTICTNFDVTEFNEGDIISIDIDETGTIKAGGRDLLITIKFKLKG